jgi:hypothetical protein
LKHRASPSFWSGFDKLPEEIQQLARKNYALLVADPFHPSLHLKRAGPYWSVRILWFWIGSHQAFSDD